MTVFRKLRLVIHLLHGMAVVALRFPRATPAQRAAMTRHWSQKLLRLGGMRLVVHNDGARLDARALVVGNHVSWADIYAINAWRPTPFVSKAEVRQWPVVGWLAAQIDTVFLQREKRTEAMRIMHEMADRLRGGGLMCVFPEGTTSDGLGLLPFHANLFQAAVSAGCAVQPICLMYEDAQGRQSLAPAYVGELSLGNSLERVLSAGSTVVHLYVCDPIEPGGDRRAMSAAAQASIQAALSEMQASVGRPAADALAALARDAYPETVVEIGAPGDAHADEPVPGREG
ncbi:1-acyl-sn-glycerol-3-phosphate acyltransferase [Burkholderia multivorans]